jgi:hypothetical protein
VTEGTKEMLVVREHSREVPYELRLRDRKQFPDT